MMPARNNTTLLSRFGTRDAALYVGIYVTVKQQSDGLCQMPVLNNIK